MYSSFPPAFGSGVGNGGIPPLLLGGPGNGESPLDTSPGKVEYRHCCFVIVNQGMVEYLQYYLADLGISESCFVTVDLGIVEFHSVIVKL